jgi:hypothetical protein
MALLLRAITERPRRAGKTPSIDELRASATRSHGLSLPPGDAQAGNDQSGRSDVVPSRSELDVCRDRHIAVEAGVGRIVSKAPPTSCTPRESAASWRRRARSRRPRRTFTTDRRDSERVLRLLMIDALHAVRVLNSEEEALRDLIRARQDLRGDLMRARRQSKLLLRHDVRYENTASAAWSARHRAWLTRVDLGAAGLSPAALLQLAEREAAAGTAGRYRTSRLAGRDAVEVCEEMCAADSRRDPPCRARGAADGLAHPGGDGDQSSRR